MVLVKAQACALALVSGRYCHSAPRQQKLTDRRAVMNYPAMILLYNQEKIDAAIEYKKGAPQRKL